MASVTIRGKVDCTDPAERIPKDLWPNLLDARKRFCRDGLPLDCRSLVFFVEDASKHGWMGFKDREEYIRNGLGLSVDMTEWALAGLESMKTGKPVSLADAVSQGLNPVGTNQHTLGRMGGPAISRAYGSTNTAYILARLDRDRPELAEEVRAGKCSARKAAITAGIIKVKAPLAHLNHWWEKASLRERRAFMKDICPQSKVH